MRNIIKTLIIFLTTTIILSSCESTIYFDSPQPRKYKNQNSFFKKIKGTFLNLNDSTLLTISDDKIESAQYVTFPLKIEDVNLEQLSKKKIKAGINAAWSADTVYKDWSSEKVLFEISEKQILRYYQEHYFLNFEKGETKWNVKLIGFDDEGYLLFKSFTENDIEVLRKYIKVDEIKNEKEKVVSYSLTPSKSGLRKLLKSNDLEGNKKYIRLLL
jgi:hypothetical protein